jgi:hypothetical protein
MPVLSQFLGKRSLLVLRFASCQAVLDEGGLPGHRSKHQAPRRSTRTIVPDVIAEPPSERSVFGEPARSGTAPYRFTSRQALWIRSFRKSSGIVRLVISRRV